jgi:hypothetical protein
MMNEMEAAVVWAKTVDGPRFHDSSCHLHDDRAHFIFPLAMKAKPSIQAEIDALNRRLEILQEDAESELRQRLKEARAVVTDLEMQLSEITGRPTATQIKVVKGFAPLTDEELEVQILYVVQKEGQEGMNMKMIGEKLNQNPVRIRGFIKNHPKLLKRVGAGPGTKFFAV